MSDTTSTSPDGLPPVVGAGTNGKPTTEEENPFHDESETSTDNTPEEDEFGELKIRVVRKERPVTLEFPNGQVWKCVLKELIGDEKDNWLEFSQSRLKFKDGRPAGLTNYKGLEPRLISMCLFNEKGERISENIIKPWPTTVKVTLFKACLKMNALDDKGEDREKND